MKEVLQVARSNVGVIAGAIAGFYLSGMAIGFVENMATPLLGASGAKFARAGSAVLVAGGAFYAASRMKKPDLAVAFGAVALGHAIQAGIAAFTPAPASQ